MDTQSEKQEQAALQGGDPKPSKLRTGVTILLTLFAFWRVAVCFREYNIGPYVTSARAAIDLVPFLQLAICLYLLARRNLELRPVRILMSIAILSGLLTMVDLSVTCSQMPTRLTAGPWATPASITKVVPQKAWVVNFQDDGQMRMTGPGGATINESWKLEMDGFRFVPRIAVGTNGHGVLLKGGEVHLVVPVKRGAAEVTIDTYIDGPTNPAAFRGSWVHP